MKYKEKFDKEMKGKRPQYDLKESKIYKTLKDANDLASEVGAHITASCHIIPTNIIPNIKDGLILANTVQDTKSRDSVVFGDFFLFTHSGTNS